MVRTITLSWDKHLGWYWHCSCGLGASNYDSEKDADRAAHDHHVTHVSDGKVCD